MKPILGFSFGRLGYSPAITATVTLRRSMVGPYREGISVPSPMVRPTRST
jgi:hypothetical protein